DYLRLLFSKIGIIICPGCQQQITRDTPGRVADQVLSMGAAGRMMVAFPVTCEADEAQMVVEQLREDGFVRAIAQGQTISLTPEADASLAQQIADGQAVHVLVDRLTLESLKAERLRESLETGFSHGNGVCEILLQEPPQGELTGRGSEVTVDGQTWHLLRFSSQLRCEQCELAFIEPDPRLFNFNSPLGACPNCEGFGN